MVNVLIVTEEKSMTVNDKTIEPEGSGDFQKLRESSAEPAEKNSKKCQKKSRRALERGAESIAQPRWWNYFLLERWKHQIENISKKLYKIENSWYICYHCYSINFCYTIDYRIWIDSNINLNCLCIDNKK